MNRRVGILADKLGITSILDKRTYEISGTGADGDSTGHDPRTEAGSGR